jgi:transposase-like protein/transposase
MEDQHIVYQDADVEAGRRGEYLELMYKTPHLIRLKVNDRQAIDDEVVRMLRMRTADDRKYFVQKEVGNIIGVSRQMINRRWQVYRQEGLPALLAGERENSKITPQLLDRLAEIVVENPFLFMHEIRERLEQEGVCGQISDGTLYGALKQMDGRRLVMLMREKSNKQVPGAFMEAGYLIQRLFRMIEQLLSKVRPQDRYQSTSRSCYEYLKRCFRHSIRHSPGPTEKDRYQPRKKLERDRRRNIGFLRSLLGVGSPAQDCPDCHSGQVKSIFRRRRYYQNHRGEKISDYSEVYRCLNPACRTKYFTRPPKGVELYARVHRDVKKMVLRWTFHLRGSLSRVCDELFEHGIKVALTTVLRWLKKAGEESVDLLSLCNQEDWTQPLCIDEKWIKVRSRWHYAFTAVGANTQDLLAVELFYHKDSQAIRTFLLQMNTQGFRPQKITTDLLLGYENVVKEVFPDCIFHECVLHAERDAKRIVRRSLPDDGEQGWRRRLVRRIRTLFKSKNIKQVKKRYAHFLKLQHDAPECVLAVFKMMQRYFPKLCQSVLQKDIPRTTNAVERAIGELEERYHLTKGFTSFYHAQFFLKAHQVYYRLRKIRFGPFRGKNRLELKDNPVGALNFTDYLTPTFDLDCQVYTP